ncbi:MAG: DUF5985 family protein [Acidobacteriaceae bacterium]
MNPISHPLADIFLLGCIAAASLIAGLFFLRFWRSTRDPLFLAFAAFFIIQGGSNAFIVSLSRPNEGSLWIFLIRLLSVLVVLGAILWKNTGKR